MDSPDKDSDESSRMCRPQPGSSAARASSRSLDAVVNFRGAKEAESSRMCRPQPGSSAARASSRSLDAVVNFRGAKGAESSRMCRPQPGSSAARASSRSLDAVVNFRRAKGAESMLRDKTTSLRSSPEGSVCSLDSLAENLDDDDRPKSPSSKSPPSDCYDELHFTFNPLNPNRRSERSVDKPLSISGSDELNPRSPSRATSRDSGITGSSGFSASSIRSELRPPPLYAGPDDVACDLCTSEKLKAWKSCLTCVRSLCELHARDHYKCIEMEEHQLVEVTKELDVYKQNAELKQMIRNLEEDNRALKEEIKSLKQGSSMLSLPAYICRGKNPTAADVVLDPETAHRALVLSHGGKRVRMGPKSKVQHGSQRFDRWECVLAQNAFDSGRHYWQVEVNKEFTIGVMKSSAQRNSRFAFAPFQGYWCLFHFWLSFSALENHVVRLPISAVPQVLGVCVDVDERWVTFYDVETKDQIYTFKDMKLGPGDRIYPVFRTVERSMDLKINTVS